MCIYANACLYNIYNAYLYIYIYILDIVIVPYFNHLLRKSVSK